MDEERLVVGHRPLVLLLSAVVPIGVCALLTTLRGTIENTNAALVLVLLVVGAATLGLRSAGIVAAVSSAVSFDFFLTAPYNQLAISDHNDVETFVLLVGVGVAVTEVALWGRRQQARASRESGYLTGLVWGTDEPVDPAAPTDPASQVGERDTVERAERQLVRLLGVDRVTFARSVDAALPVLLPSGEVRRDGRLVDVDRAGLPTDTPVTLVVRSGRSVLGGFVLIAAAHVARPSRRQRQVAVLLADKVGDELVRSGGEPGGLSSPGGRPAVAGSSPDLD